MLNLCGVQVSSGPSRHWGGHAGLMLQAEIGRHARPNTGTGDEGDRSHNPASVQRFHVKHLEPHFLNLCGERGRPALGADFCSQHEAPGVGRLRSPDPGLLLGAGHWLGDV